VSHFPNVQTLLRIAPVQYAGGLIVVIVGVVLSQISDRIAVRPH
jgi:hypothetical protein